jgi:hypothetical protein
MKAVGNGLVERLFFQCSGWFRSISIAATGEIDWSGSLPPDALAWLNPTFFGRTHNAFEVAFGRVKSEALRAAMRFLISGEFARDFEKAIASAEP